MLIARARRLAATITAHLHERALLLPEHRIISLVVNKAERLSDNGADKAELVFLREVHDKNSRRLAELKARRINRAVFALRSLMLRLPTPIQASAKGILGGMLGRARGRPVPGLARSAPLRLATAVPFGKHLPPPTLSAPVGVIMHIFYPELAAEMRAYLKNIPGPVDLYISTDTAEKQKRLDQIFTGWAAGQVTTRLAPNRGRDIAPKLVSFRDVYARHSIVLHLHSKKSPHDSCLRMWRYFLFENLMGEREIATSILAALEHTPSLGMVASDHYFAVSNNIAWDDNLDIAQALARRMGMSIDPEAPLDFPSGSMFWAKSAALKPLLDLNLSAEDFPPEDGQVDATLAHAIERIYFRACEEAGFEWVRVCRPELAGDDGQRAKGLNDRR
ncbi:MAG TPA: rhamnan synthesis F family protein [Caulobacteraceae bacterium]|nr:rhamnan synthesis F family protein [Caulobacteraceae bacterium]